jgi:transposase-like protein
MNVSEKPKAHRRDASEIVSLIEQCGASGLTVSEFCAQHGLNEGTFHTWKKRYRTFGGEAATARFCKAAGEAEHAWVICRGKWHPVIPNGERFVP